MMVKEDKDSVHPNLSTINNDSSAFLNVINCSESSSDSYDSDSELEEDNDPTSSAKKRKKFGTLEIPADFLTPLPPAPTTVFRVEPLNQLPVTPVSQAAPLSTIPLSPVTVSQVGPLSCAGPAISTSTSDMCRQFWKAGDYNGCNEELVRENSGKMEHVRVHPKFLHSNATSHKWALGAFAELLDNSLDEVPNGATLVNIEVLDNRKDGGKMLLIEDNGGGMDPEKIRQCMSFGFSAKSKLANTIGQYGNGFKTSTMRLGSDVMVFSRCSDNHKKSSFQSVGLLSYTFLRSTGKEDIVVPMLDFERTSSMEWKKMIRSTVDDWDSNMETLIEWSPFNDEADLLNQFDQMSSTGTKIIIYNLWEDDEGMLELDFSADPHDIQLRGVNRDEEKIQLANKCPNSRHFLTYKHSLRSYSSILYRHLPENFQIILRGKEVPHHNILDDMMMVQEITYKPQGVPDGTPHSTVAAVVSLGFVKDAIHHIDIQGFNVYHKNRLIKPFWRLWNASGSDGRGVIGVLEANFVEPAHDKQGFERTIILARLEARLIQMQKNYWSSNCHKIGYAPRRSKATQDKMIKNDAIPNHLSATKRKHSSSNGMEVAEIENSGSSGKQRPQRSNTSKLPCLPYSDDSTVNESPSTLSSNENKKSTQSTPESNDLQIIQPSSSSQYNDSPINQSPGGEVFASVKLQKPRNAVTSIYSWRSKSQNEENNQRLETSEIIRCELSDIPKCERCMSLESLLKDAHFRIEKLNKDFAEEKELFRNKEEGWSKKFKDSSETIQNLLSQMFKKS